MIRTNGTVCDIPKNNILYTPSNAEFKNNSSALKNLGFVEESVIEMLRAGIVK